MGPSSCRLKMGPSSFRLKWLKQKYNFSLILHKVTNNVSIISSDNAVYARLIRLIMQA